MQQGIGGGRGAGDTFGEFGELSQKLTILRVIPSTQVPTKRDVSRSDVFCCAPKHYWPHMQAQDISDLVGCVTEKELVQSYLYLTIHYLVASVVGLQVL